MLDTLRRRGPPAPRADRPTSTFRRAGEMWRDPRWAWVVPTLAAAGMAVAYLLTDPRTADLSAHIFRADLFGSEGFTLWSNAWYGGHHVPAYSVLFPPLAWLLGPQLVGAVACVVAAALFERIVQARWGERARFGALWLGVGIGSLLFTDRLPFALGVALGLAALLALQRRRVPAAVVLGAASSLASPVAGLFVALAGTAYALSQRLWPADEAPHAVRAGLAVAAGALTPILLLAGLFPEGGEHPFVASSYVAVPLFAVAALVLLPSGEIALRVGVVLYLAGATAAFLVDTPAGGNVARLGSLFAGPVMAAALAGRVGRGWRAVALAVTLVALTYWQWAPAVRAALPLNADPSTERAYYEPLIDRLEERPPSGRVEIPFLASHFEAAYVADRFPLARGWERQLDVERNPLFYDGELHSLEYARWLRENAVSHVAVADAPNDYAGQAERRLVDEEPPFLRPVWGSGEWRLYAVREPTPLVTPEPRTAVELVELGRSTFTLDFATAGGALVRVRWTPYWLAGGACVEPAGEWTRVTAAAPGTVRVEPAFAPGRIGSEERRCG